MTRICIDTHALSWHVARPNRLGHSARRILRQVDAGEAVALIPVIVVVEIAILSQTRRISFATTNVDALVGTQPAFSILAMDQKQATEFVSLRAIRDPFDRMILAAARISETPLITADAAIHESALVETIWD